MTMTQLPSAGEASAGGARAGESRAGRTRAREATAELASVALDRAVGLLLSKQHEDGRWQDPPEASVSVVTQHLLLHGFLGAGLPDQMQTAARWIRARQRPDGGWAESGDGAADLTAAVQAYVVLRLAGDPPDAYHMALAAGWIRDAGGPAGAGAAARIWLALAGLHPWEELPAIPPEIVFLPKRVLLSLPGRASWVRGALLPLAVIGSVRPGSMSFSFDLSELQPPGGGPPIRGHSPAPRWRQSGLAGWIRQVMRGWWLNAPTSMPSRSGGAAVPRRSGAAVPRRVSAAVPRRSRAAVPRRSRTAVPRRSRTAVPRHVRAAAISRCAEWIAARQDRDGSWGQTAPLSAISLVALRLAGYPLAHPSLARGLAWLDQLAAGDPVRTVPVMRLQASACAVRETAQAVTALAEAGLPPGSQALASAWLTAWLRHQEFRRPGDWQVRRRWRAAARRAAGTGGGGRPDVHATSAVLLALRRAAGLRSVGVPDPTEGALGWLAGLQSRDGSWGNAESGRRALAAATLPSGAAALVADQSSAAATAHAVAAMSAVGLAGTKAARRGVIWLLRAQDSDGSWSGCRDAGATTVTSTVLRALIAAGVVPGKPPVRRAVRWLVRGQNGDGGWADQPGRTGTHWPGRGSAAGALRIPAENVTPAGAWHGWAWSGTGPGGTGPAGTGSTAVATAEAVLALVAAGGSDAAESAGRGVRWLARCQHPDGDWDQPQRPGLALTDGCQPPPLSRLCCPIRALGRYLAGVT